MTEPTRRQFLRILGLGAVSVAVPPAAAKLCPMNLDPISNFYNFTTPGRRARRIDPNEVFKMDLCFPGPWVFYICKNRPPIIGRLSDIPKGPA